MKILAISGTPHKGFGASTSVLNALFEGVKKIEPDAVCETVFVSGKKIGYCKGCAHCLTKGDCTQKDDMDEIVGNIRSADGVILASPVYVLGVTAQMKTFIDRMLPLAHRPFLMGKYGAAVSVSAGWGHEAVADYLAGFLTAMGASVVGTAYAEAAGPGMFKDKEGAFACAARTGESLARAIGEKWKLPESSACRNFQLFLVELFKSNPKLFQADYNYWREKGYIKEGE
jgi:multimeric flavodoxin WrbA